MPQLDYSVVVAPVTFPRPAAGFRRMVQVIHPHFGAIPLLTTDVSISDATQPNYTKYAFTPGSGAKQKAIHTAGTKEISWNLGGEVTASSLGLVQLLNSSARGVPFQKLLVFQGNDGFLFDNPLGVTLPWSQMTLSGNPNAGLTFALEGKSTVLPLPWGTVQALVADEQVPTWTTGNDFVLSWSISHSVSLTAHWFNNTSMFPAYYRAGESEFTVQVSTGVVLREHTLIRIGYGHVFLAEMVATSRNKTFGDRNSPVTYSATSTNVKLVDQNGYQDFVDILIAGVPQDAYHYGPS